ncbi:MAG: HIT domain-containing protein [Gammaproteobacteria bacterium]|nr:MAG: HIT domain-containing protein [Gammaproteobacteria bacterium]
MRFELHPTLARDGFTVGDLPLSHVLLMNDERFPWFILVPRRPNIREVYELSQADRILLQDEIAYFGESLMKALSGNKLNVAALGNQVPQLHVHLVVRFHHDAAWPNPIWCQGAPEPMTETTQKTRMEIGQAIIRQLIAQHDQRAVPKP